MRQSAHNNVVLAAAFDTSAAERIRLRFTEFKGYKLLDERLYYQGNNGWLPTGMGFATIRLDEIADQVEAAEEANRQFRASRDADTHTV